MSAPPAAAPRPDDRPPAAVPDPWIARRHLVVEVTAWIAGLAILLIGLRSMLFYGESTLLHDNHYWYYPVFKHFAISLLEGRIPLWNPYSHGGEPFWPMLLHFRLLDPLQIGTITVGRAFTQDPLLLFNWSAVVQRVVMCLGIYAVLRRWAPFGLIRLSLVPILLYSSIFLSSFRQDGVLNHFLWVPWIAWLLLRILLDGDARWRTWLALAGLVGLNWQSYFFAGLSLFLLFFFVGLACFRRDLLRDLARMPGLGRRLAVGGLLVAAMLGPNLVVLRENRHLVIVARLTDSSFDQETKALGGPLQYEGDLLPPSSDLGMTYTQIFRTGTFSSIWDFIQLLCPWGNRNIRWRHRLAWGDPSESQMYIGMIPWAIAIVGVAAGVDGLKRVWGLVAVCFGLLLLGPSGGLHPLLHKVFPPLWFMRHTHVLALFFLFPMLYYFVLGGRVLQEWLRRRAGPADWPGGERSWVVCALAVAAYTTLIILMPETGFGEWKVIVAHLAGLVAVGAAAARFTGRTAAWLCLVPAQLAAMLLFKPHRSAVGYVLTLQAAPVLAYLLAFVYRHERTRRAVVILFCTLAFSLGLLDLIVMFHGARVLYASQQPAEIARPVSGPRGPAALAAGRKISPGESIGRTSQSRRYLSLLDRQPYVFSPRMSRPEGFIPGLGPALVDPDSFAGALRWQRWNCFFLLRPYFDLLHSGVPPAAMAVAFAVSEPPFQYRPTALIRPDAEVASLLKSLPSEEAAEALRRAVFVAPEGAAPPPSLTSATLPDASPGLPASGGPTIVHHDEQGVELEADVPRESLVYWSDGYDRHWRATVDGRDVPIHRANLNFKAFAVPAGRSRIRLRYEPVPFLAAVALFYAAAAVAFGGALTAAAVSLVRPLRSASQITKHSLS
jgi:hypothetical protein